MPQNDDLDLDVDFEDDDDYEFDDGTKLVKQLRRELTRTKKALKERDGELSSLKSESRKRAVRDVLSDKGLNPKIAAFIPADIDPDEQAISAWIDEYGDVFGMVQVAPSQGQVSAVDADTIRRMSAVEDAGTAAEYDGDIASLIAKATSREELQAILGNA